MSTLYTVEINDNNSITVSKPSSTTLCYRINYSELKSGEHGLEIKNPFIVYILHGKNYEGKDYLYIGKSKNGILNRPQSHENMNIKWDMCYVLTQFVERTMLNDGTLQYIEDIITEKAKETKCFEVKTKQTTKGAANKSDKYMCKLFLEDVLDMLDILGLDLKIIKKEEHNIIKDYNEKEIYMISKSTKNYSFKGCNIPIGTELTFRKNDNIKVTTVDDTNLVNYNGIIMNISKAAWYCFNKKDTWKYNGFIDFKYNNKSLIDVYREEISKNSDINTNIKYWTFAAGRNSELWDNFYTEGIMGLHYGFSKDLSKYKNKEEIKEDLRKFNNSKDSYSQAGLMLWQFANEMNPGDIIFVKKGAHEIVGKGIVTSDYYFDPNGIAGFTHFRKVNWTDKGSCIVKKYIAQKTLTDITPYKEYVAEFNKLNFSNDIIETIDTKKEILINQLFTGKYNEMGDNIGHEIINIFRDDSGIFNLFITPSGKVENHNIDTILFVKNENKPYVVEVVGMATNLQIFNADKDPLITYNGKTEKEIFYGNQYKGTIETNDESPVMYRTNDIKMPVNRLYLGVKDLVNDDNIILIDNNEKKLTNTSMRSYHKEGSDIYKKLEEIINSTDWKPLDTDEIYKRCSDNKIFEQSYTRFMNKINK